ncbi:hypothetical protein [Promicromonospora sukumoe]|uniref:hypothetical protein n=1 Tax=Promicromonospora sukumoe TaxID=88382 RepID=UPI003663BC47
MSSDTVPRWPRIDAIVREDGSGEVTIDGTFHPIAAGSLEEARVEVLRRVTENAVQIGRPVRASATGPEGLWNLIVHPDGTVVPEEEEVAAQTQAPPVSAQPGQQPEQRPEPVREQRPEPLTDPLTGPGTIPAPAFEGVPVADLAPGGNHAVEEPAGAEQPGAEQADPNDTDTVRRAPRPADQGDVADPGSPADQAAAPDLGTSDPGAPDAAAPDQGAPAGGALPTVPVHSHGKGTDGANGADTNGVGAHGRNGYGTSGYGTDSYDGGDQDVADRFRDDAGQDLPGSAPAGTPGDLPASGPGSPASQAPVDAVPTAGYPGPAGYTSTDGYTGSEGYTRPDDYSGQAGYAGYPGPDDGLSAPPSGPTRAVESDAPRSRREARQSFLTHQQDEDPATQGFRGFLTRMGLRVGPSESERAERADERAVSQHWPGPRTISMVNGKGGAGKTPSTVLLAAVFAQFGGAGVVTWDNNQTRGTLGWRTEQGPHESTLLDLLPQTDRLLGPSAQAADLARYVHHQTRDRFDVLRSKPIAMANEQRIEPQDVDAIHSVLSKYYRMILIDSGNDESDPMWQRMIDLTDQLVVATTTRDDHAEAGALLLEALGTRDGRSAYLAQQAVVVVSQADPKESSGELENVADGYRSLAREVVTIPFDPAMVDGHLRYGALRPETRRAWLAAGAAVAGGL